MICGCRASAGELLARAHRTEYWSLAHASCDQGNGRHARYKNVPIHETQFFYLVGGFEAESLGSAYLGERGGAGGDAPLTAIISPEIL